LIQVGDLATRVTAVFESIHHPMAFSCGDRLHRQAFFLSLSGNMLLDLPVRPTGFFLSIF